MRYWLVVTNDKLRNPVMPPMSLKEISSYFCIAESSMDYRMKSKYWDRHPEEPERAIHVLDYKDKEKYKEWYKEHDKRQSKRNIKEKRKIR